MNSLPKCFGIYFDYVPGPNHPVIEYLNREQTIFNGDSFSTYYGINSIDEPYCGDKDNFDVILTEQQFLDIINGVKEPIYCVVEMMDCELLGVRSGTKEQSTELFKTLIKENDENMKDEWIDLCLIRGNFVSSDGYKVYLLESKII